MARPKPDAVDLELKLLLIGNTSVGKSCLLLRFVEDMFTPSYLSTIGIDFKTKVVELEGKRVRLRIWDTAGQERFRTMTTSYYRGAHVIALVYDVTNRKSFDAIADWSRQIDEFADTTVCKVLIGNKCDCKEDMVVTEAEGRRLADSLRIPFFLTSAKNNINIQEAFIGAAEEVLSKQMHIKPTKPMPDTPGGGSGGSGGGSGGSGGAGDSGKKPGWSCCVVM